MRECPCNKASFDGYCYTPDCKESEKMNIGKAIGIFHKINSSEYTLEEKGEAILNVVKMPTHNSITKAAMLEVINFLLNELFEIKELGNNGK